jgi:hypothetical protein
MSIEILDAVTLLLRSMVNLQARLFCLSEDLERRKSARASPEYSNVVMMQFAANCAILSPISQMAQL